MLACVVTYNNNKHDKFNGAYNAIPKMIIALYNMMGNIYSELLCQRF